MHTKSSTVMNQVQKVYDIVKQLDYRIRALEKQIAEQIDIDERKALESELEVAKKLLKKNEDKLRTLRKDNSKTFMISACFVFIIFLIYGLYSMIFNANKF